MIAALYVDPDGVYSGLPDVELWDEARDARCYDGPWPVVAHPPCARWGKYWHGGPSRPHTEKLGFYGHPGNKPTWLYAVGIEPPSLRWGAGEQRLDPVMLARHGYEKARRCGITAMAGGKRKTEIRNATPPAFRDVLLSIAASACTATKWR